MKQLRNKAHLNKSRLWCVIVILLGCLLPRLILCMQAYPLRTRVDELATMGGAAFFAGLDWSGLMSEAPYYGTGFTGLFSFIFRLTDNPLVIFRFMISMGAVLQSLTGLICFRIMSKFFHVKNKAVLILCSIMSSYMVVTRAVIVYNEHMLIFLMWVITYLLLYMNYYEDKKKKRIATVLLGCVLGYSFTIHTRAIIFTIILVVLILAAYLYKRIKVVDIPVFAVMCSVGLLIAQCYVKWVQKTVWVPAEGEVLTNSSISVGNKLGLLTDPDAWKAIFYTVIGQINTISAVTAGVALLMLFVTIGLIWRARGRKGKKDKTINLILIVLVYSVGCIAITIAGQSITWLNGVKEVVETGRECDLYATKAFTYIRYFGPYCGPLVMMFGVLLDKCSKMLRKCILPTILCMIGTQLVWLVAIVPYIANITTNNGVSEAMLFFVGANRQALYDYAFFYKVVAVAFVLVLVIMLLLRYNKKKVLLTAMTVLLVYQYVYNAWVWDITGNQIRGYNMADSSYRLIQQLEEEIELPKAIYVAPNNNDIYQYQFMLNRYLILSGVPEQEEAGETVILFSRNEIEEELEGYTMFRLEKKEHMYVKGEQLIQAIERVLSE